MKRKQMTFASYSDAAKRTLTDIPLLDHLTMAALGLTGESGEFADLIKKRLFHDHTLDIEHAKKELGDILWYLNAAALGLGTTLEEIAQMNIEKLMRRYPNGFSPQASQQRTE